MVWKRGRFRLLSTILKASRPSVVRLSTRFIRTLAFMSMLVATFRKFVAHPLDPERPSAVGVRYK
jgi:hypothetical protein